MTTTNQLDSERPEPLSQRAARRLRGCLAENRISQSELARVIHMPQQKLSRKVTGFTPLTLDEIDAIAWALEIEVAAVLGTGVWADRAIGLCAIRDSNPEPADSEPSRSPLTLLVGDGPNVVVALPLRRETRELATTPRAQLVLVGEVPA